MRTQSLEQRHSGTSDMTFTTQVPIGINRNYYYEKLLLASTIQIQIDQLLRYCNASSIIQNFDVESYKEILYQFKGIIIEEVGDKRSR